MTTKGMVHVIDDDPAMRDSVAFLLDTHGLSCRLYESATAFLEHLPGLEPGCIVTDVRMPQMSGLDLVRRLNEFKIHYPVIVMTGHGDIALAVTAMKAGVTDFIEKPFAEAHFIAIVSGALTQKTQPEHLAAKTKAGEQLAQLTPRERDVLIGIVAGKPNKIIAFELDISPRTVEVYRANLMTKSGARSVAELMRIALAAGL